MIANSIGGRAAPILNPTPEGMVLVKKNGKIESKTRQSNNRKLRRMKFSFQITSICSKGMKMENPEPNDFVVGNANVESLLLESNETDIAMADLKKTKQKGSSSDEEEVQQQQAPMKKPLVTMQARVPSPVKKPANEKAIQDKNVNVRKRRTPVPAAPQPPVHRGRNSKNMVEPAEDGNSNSQSSLTHHNMHSSSPASSSIHNIMNFIPHSLTNGGGGGGVQHQQKNIAVHLHTSASTSADNDAIFDQQAGVSVNNVWLSEIEGVGLVANLLYPDGTSKMVRCADLKRKAPELLFDFYEHELNLI